MTQGSYFNGPELQVKGQFFSGKGMVGIEHQVGIGDTDDRNEHGLIVLLRELKTLSHLGVHALRQLAPAEGDNEVLAVLPVGLIRGNADGLRVSRAHADDRLFEPRDHLSVADGELQGMTFL